MTTSLSTIGVCVLNAPPRNSPGPTGYSHYIHEILGHAGLFYRTLQPESLHDSLPGLRLLVTIGEGEWPGETQTALRNWVQEGGAWLSLGGVGGLHDLFGVQARQPLYRGVAWGGQSATLGEGYLQPSEIQHPILAGVPLPLHFFNGLAVLPSEGTRVLAGTLDAHGRADTEGDAYAGIVERQIGKGRCLLVAPDLVGAIVRIQQGNAVTRDGVPARDGSCTVTDGMLKCDDGIALDWILDRQEVPGAPGLRCFLEPIADHWRALLLRAIFYLATQHKVPLALLWLYPRNLPALAHLSHDSDHNDPPLARRLLEVTAEENVPATWCIILPGHAPDIIEVIRAGGHELATHYDAVDHEWSENEFDSQLAGLRQQFGEDPVSNKNHYTRWEGDTEFFGWCLKRGIQIDGSKGPSKFGETGFCFGTSLPFFPVAPDGELLDVLELPFLSQDLQLFISDVVVPPLLEGILKVHGVMHLLFHPSHIGRTEVEQALRNAVRAARDAGLEWWTSRRLNDWERARRGVSWSPQDVTVPVSCTLLSPLALEDATLLFLNPDGATITIDGAARETLKTVRWGFEFSAATLTIDAAHAHDIALA